MAKTPTSATDPSHPMRRNERGFTLLELLLVVAIIAIMTGLASLSLGGNDSRLLQKEAERLQQLLLMAQDEATIHQQTLGLKLQANGYYFLKLNEVSRLWQPVDSAPFSPHQYDIPLHASLELNGAPLTLAMPGDADTKEPELLILAGGETSAFIINLQLAENAHNRLQLHSDGFSPITLRAVAHES